MNLLSVLLCSEDVPSGRPWIPSRGIVRCLQVAAGVLMISLVLVLYQFVGEAHGPNMVFKPLHQNRVQFSGKIWGNISFTSKTKPIAQLSGSLDNLMDSSRWTFAADFQQDVHANPARNWELDHIPAQNTAAQETAPPLVGETSSRRHQTSAQARWNM